jgi:nicotinate-nucleotide pyrophosphorylase (carboxylating)
MSTPSRPSLTPLLVEDVIRRALEEDLGRRGDLTTDALIPDDATAVGRIISREPGVAAGIEVAAAVFRALSAQFSAAPAVDDGEAFAAGSTLLRLSGAARVVLTAERTALNLLGRLCGIATITRRYVDAVAGTNARITCTRKTTPGLRALEKYAVRCGGGWNHRFGLDDAVLVKDNHLLAVGGVGEAVARARAAVGHTVTVEVEVESLAELEEALAAGADVVMLDNMGIDTLRRAVSLTRGRALTEASGGITLETVAEVAATGVDLISVGALTHSAPALDLSLDLDANED